MITEFDRKVLIRNINALKNDIIKINIELQSINPANLQPSFIDNVNKKFKIYFSHIKRIFEIPLNNILFMIPDSFEKYKKENSYLGMLTSLDKNITLQNINEDYYKREYIDNTVVAYIYWILYLESYKYETMPLEQVIREIYETAVYRQKYMKYKNKYIRLLNKSLI
jgi:hypothetical protein